MAEGKKSFVLYTDQIGIFDKLSHEQAGKLIKHIFCYVNDENPTGDFVTELAFESIKQQLKRDLNKWEVEMSDRSTSGKEGNLKRWHKDLYDQYKGGKITLETALDKAKESKKSPPDKKASPPIAKVADNVTVNDNDNVIDNDNETVNNKGDKKIYPSDVYKCYDLCIKHFEKHLLPKKEKDKCNWLDTIDKLRRIEKIRYSKIVEIVKYTRNSWWKKNFLSMAKLRKKNGEGVMYIVVFYENMKPNETKEGTTGQEYSEDWMRKLYNDLG